MIKNKPLFLLVTLTILGGLLRFVYLSKLPVSLNWDEVSHGFNAYSLLTTGKDEWGRPIPLIFRAFGDYKLPLYIYLTILPVWMFGLNSFAVRFVSALFGTLAIPGIYLLTHILFPNHQVKLKLRKTFTIHISLVSAFLVTFMPWHFFISRPALEANLSLTLTIWGAYFLIGFFRHCDKPKNAGPEYPKYFSLLPAGVLLGLSMHAYNSARIFVPMLLISSVYIFRRSLRFCFHNDKKFFFHSKNILGLLFLTLSTVIIVYQVLAGEGTARYEKLKILSDSAVFQIGEARSRSTLPPSVAKLVHNRPIYFTTTFLNNYLNYFSPAFFYQKWGSQFQFAIPGWNLLTLPIFLLTIIGVIFALKNIKNPYIAFVLVWLLLAPVAAALTADPPQALRPTPLLPAIVLLASLGLFFLSEKLKPTGLWSVLTLLFVPVCFSTYLYIYQNNYAAQYSQSWQFGYQRVMDYIATNRDQYQNIFITKRYGEPHIFYAFFTKLPPEKIQPGKNNIRFLKSDWWWTDRIDNVYFINDWQIPITTVSSLPLESGDSISTAKSLLITSPDHVPVNAHVIETVNFLDGQPAFIICSIP